MSWSDGECIILSNKMEVQRFEWSTNKMSVIICEMHGAPITGYMRVVRAGSKDEQDGGVGAGIAHFIEHMSFRIDGGRYWELEKLGHEDNAMTNETSTRFYDLGHSKHIKEVINLDASRFLTNEVPEEGIPIEMKAVLNEEERGRQAVGTLFRTAQSTAHMFSRYHYPTIGTRHDIETTTAADMKKFREVFYKLNNSTFVVVGHVDTREILNHFVKVYGAIPAETPVVHDYPAEPLQIGRRIINLKMPAQCSMSCMTWVSPAASSRESVCLSVLEKIISNGDNGRKRKLVDAGVVHGIGSYSPRNVDRYIFCIHSAFGHHDEKTLVKGENSIYGMLKDIRLHLSTSELKLAVDTVNQDWDVLPFKNIHSTLMAIGEAVDRGDWKDLSSRVETLKTITVDDIKSTIAKFLTEDLSTTVRVFPIPSEKISPTTATLEQASVCGAVISQSQRKLEWVCKSTVQTKGNASLQVIHASTEEVLCSISMPCPFAARHTASHTMELFGKRCVWNNRRLTETDVLGMFDSLGIKMQTNVDKEHVHILFSLNKPSSFQEAINFVTSGLINDAIFDGDSLISKKRQNAAELAALKKNQSYTTKKQLITRLFDCTDYHESVAEKIRFNNNVSKSHVKNFYSTHMKGQKKWTCTLMIPDKFEPANMIKKLLTTCKSARASTEKISNDVGWRPKPSQEQFNQVVLNGFGSSDVYMGQVTSLKKYDKQALALQLGVQALGGGMTGRLMSILRGKDGDKNGVYGVYASTYHQAYAPTYVVINATFTPELQEHGMNELRHEVSRWNTSFITEEELLNGKNELIGKRALEMDNFLEVEDIYHTALLDNKNPTGEWDSFVDKVQNTTLEEVNNAIKLLDPHKWVMVSTSPKEMPLHWEDSDTEN